MVRLWLVIVGILTMCALHFASAPARVVSRVTGNCVEVTAGSGTQSREDGVPVTPEGPSDRDGSESDSEDSNEWDGEESAVLVETFMFSDPGATSLTSARQRTAPRLGVKSRVPRPGERV